MPTKLKRPTSVWVAQILLFVLGLIFLTPLSVTIPALFIHGPNASLGRLVVVAAANVALVALIAAAVWGMFRRRPYGRWLGVAMLSVSLAMMVFGQLYGDAEAAGRTPVSIAGQLLISVLFIMLIGYLAFDRRVAAFFSSPWPERSATNDTNAHK